MRKTLIVALREYIVSVRTKAFLIGLLMMPLMMGGGFIVGALMQGRSIQRTSGSPSPTIQAGCSIPWTPRHGSVTRQ